MKPTIWLWLVLFCCAGYFFPSSSIAQSKLIRSYGGSSRLALIRKDSVKRELDLSKSQSREIDAVYEKIEKEINAMYTELRNLPASEMSRIWNLQHDQFVVVYGSWRH